MSWVGRPDLSVAPDAVRSFIGGLMRELDVAFLSSVAEGPWVFVPAEEKLRG